MGDTNKAEQPEHGELTYKDYCVCPLSGIGKPPTKWSACVAECSLYDVTTGFCSMQALWHLRELPHIHDRVQGVANVLEACL